MLTSLRRHRRDLPATLIRVHGGYQPAVVYAQAGEPLRLVFLRQETAPCSERVVFPDFGKSAMLPPYQEVTVDLQPEQAGEYEFTCQLGVLRGTIVVEGGGPRR